MITLVKIKKDNKLYTFNCIIEENYNGKIDTINEENRWFLNQIKKQIEDILK